MGLSYGIVSQFVNRIALPGVPLYQPPLGPVGNSFLWLTVGLVLGLLGAWPQESITGAILSSIAGTILIVTVTLLGGEVEQRVLEQNAFGMLFLFLPIVASLLPFLWVNRWVVDRIVAGRSSSKHRRSIWLPFLLILLAGGAGAFTLHPSYARQEILSMEAMLQSGLSAGNDGSLPAPLQSERVGGFRGQAKGTYTLEWDNYNIRRYAIPRQGTDRPEEEAAVIARFENSWMLVCIFPKAGADPSCKGFGSEALSYIVRGVVVNPLEHSWEDFSLFRENLVEAEQSVLSQAPGATIYHIDLELSSDSQSLRGRQQVFYTNRENMPLDKIFFRLFPNASGGRVAVTVLKVDGTDIPMVYQFEDSALAVSLPTPLKPGGHIVIDMDFNVQLPVGRSGNYGLFGHSEGVLSLDSVYPVIPVYDDEGWNVEIPAQNAEYAYFDASYYLVRVAAPASLTVVASGIEVGYERTLDRQMVTFACGPARDFYLVLSDQFYVSSQKVGETKVNSYSFRYHATRARYAHKYAMDALSVFGRVLGAYPYTEFDIAAIPMDALGAEYPGLITLALSLYESQDTRDGWSPQARIETTTVHEVAHQWFYNMVGNDQVDEPWLDEALAQYLVHMYFTEVYNQGVAAQRLIDYWDGCLARNEKQDIPIGLPAAEYVNSQEYVSAIYCRSPKFIIALAETMGQQAFQAFLTDYFSSHKWGIASSESFKQLAEKHCDCDLNDLFATWVSEN